MRLSRKPKGADPPGQRLRRGGGPFAPAPGGGRGGAGFVLEQGVDSGRGGGLVDDAPESEAEGGRPAGPAPAAGGVLLAADDVVGLDPAVLGAADLLDQADRLADHAGRVGE